MERERENIIEVLMTMRIGASMTEKEALDYAVECIERLTDMQDFINAFLKQGNAKDSFNLDA